VGALTVGIDHKGLIFPQNVLYPTQFTQKGVDEILTVKFWNAANEKVTPKVYSRVDWYRERLNDINESIILFDREATMIESD